MRIRPCIDLHNGKVKQIVGGTLRDGKETARDAAGPCGNTAAAEPEDEYAAGHNRGSAAKENFVSERRADYYAEIYRERNLPGGHIILLNSQKTDPELYEADRQQAFLALRAYAGGMQVGGGITPENAAEFLDAGASHVIVTSYVFRDGKLDRDRLQKLEQTVGKNRLVLDLSCRRRGDRYYVVTDRWQKWTELEVDAETLNDLSCHCDEFLIHAADVEGQRKGIEKDLVHILGAWLEVHPFPVTYAGGVHSLEDLEVMKRESGGLLDVTVGSALNLFGGTLSLDSLVEAVRL